MSGKNLASLRRKAWDEEKRRFLCQKKHQRFTSHGGSRNDFTPSCRRRAFASKQKDLFTCNILRWILYRVVGIAVEGSSKSK